MTAKASPFPLRTWLLAARVPTLPAAVVPVLVGTGLAIGRHHFRPVIFAVTALAALLIQIGTNFANDYFDYQKGADTAARVGPTRVTAAGLASPRTVLRATIIAFGLAALLGVYLIVQGGWPILVVGILSILAGVAYTGGPTPFGYHGLGDAVCFLFFGVVAVAGTYYLQAGTLSATAVLASIPVACLVTAILVVNNVRDIDSDRVAGKMTLATRLGRRGTRVEYGLLLALAYVSPVVLAARGVTLWWLFWLPWATVPLAISLMKVVSRRIDGRSLNVVLKGTGRLHLFFGVLFALSLMK